ncbi:hypothetical protein [Streptomyces sp. Ru62]|uniref:hypothetical protein n=1 Tax=Streptomyces sp. Ru62 TaxID=2080745 RepID=UPI001CA4FB91
MAEPASVAFSGEDFSRIPDAFGTPYTYWARGCVNPHAYQAARQRGTVAQDIPVNHSPRFAPVLQPTLDTGVQALVTAALTHLGKPTRTSWTFLPTPTRTPQPGLPYLSTSRSPHHGDQLNRRRAAVHR